MGAMEEKKDAASEDQPAISTPVEEPMESKPSETTVVASSKRRRPWILIAVVIVILCLAIGYGGARLYEQWSQREATTSHQGVESDGNKIVTQEEEDIAGVADKVSPSVVSIITTISSGRSYFGVQEQQGAGTGIIVSKDGYVLTNKHVVSDATTVSVIRSDGTTYDNVQVLGTDPLNDIAFLKIPDVGDLPAVSLGDSSSVRVGQKVVAIGNALGQYQNTVTSGIISGTGRPVSAQDGNSTEDLTDLLQTDAAINSGNSGGPLLNLTGQVIGINTAIAEDAQGIGFAIPINAAKGVLKGVLEGKGVQRAYLGVNYVPITAEAAKYYNLSVKKGAYVYSGSGQVAVVAGGPADKAGIKEKDIITKVGGVEVGDKGGVASLIGEYAPGDTVELTILRGGQTLTVNVTLAAYK